jgi:penicillin-binding protein 2
MDPKTGFLLAVVDRPSPDPNKLSGRISKAELAAMHSDPLTPELFRAVQAQYFPGSTFKAITAVAALEEGAFHPGSTIYCPGHYRLGNHTWRCDKESGHGNVDLTHALGASCDVFFYALGDRLGTNKIAKYARMMGYGRPTGLDIAGENPGVIPDEAWFNARIPGGYRHGFSLNTAIGQGDVKVTPMQQVVTYAALATGKVWKPQVVMEIQDAKGEVVEAFPPVEQGTVDIKKETREAVLSGLRAAVNEPYGTAFRSRLKDVVMGGKTGTAQVVKLGAKRVKAADVPYFERDHAWFVSFAPLDDPKIVVAVLNEHSGFGAANAAPTASAVVKRYLELLEADEAERTGARKPDAPAEPAAEPPREKPATPENEVEKKVKLGRTGTGGGARGA